MFSQRSSGEKAGTVETPSPRFFGAVGDGREIQLGGGCRTSKLLS
jgi:hypothetical protein